MIPAPFKETIVLDDELKRNVRSSRAAKKQIETYHSVLCWSPKILHTFGGCVQSIHSYNFMIRVQELNNLLFPGFCGRCFG
jgi:hypothetical protein